MAKNADYRVAAHYLFDLRLPTEKVAEVMGVSVEWVQQVYGAESSHRV